MPVQQIMKNGRTGYRFGNSGHVYYGTGAKAKAQLQERAAYAAGYQKDKKKWQDHYLLADQELKRTGSGQNRQDPTSNTQDFV